MMGLAMAREAKTPANERGMRSEGTVYASEEVHMSIPKSVALLGIGRENLRLIPTNASFQMIPEELDRAIRRDKKARKSPIAVVATAGTVNTGAIDSIAVAGLWLPAVSRCQCCTAGVCPQRGLCAFVDYGSDRRLRIL